MKMFFALLLYNCIFTIIAGLVAGSIIALIPAKYFQPQNNSLYNELKFEKGGRVYDKFKIQRWKDKVPQFSEIVHKGFSKGNLKSINKGYLERFYLETVRAEFCHRLLILISPVFYFVNQNKMWGITFAILYALGNVPFIMIQRYNRPRIKKIMDGLKTKK